MAQVSQDTHSAGFNGRILTAGVKDGECRIQFGTGKPLSGHEARWRVRIPTSGQPRSGDASPDPCLTVFNFIALQLLIQKQKTGQNKAAVFFSFFAITTSVGCRPHLAVKLASFPQAFPHTASPFLP